MITDRIKQTIEKHSLIKKGESVLVGLSGGADSVCLTHALKLLENELGIKVYTAHLNHGIRGEEALRDEEFAKSFSERLDIKCFVMHADIPALAREKGISEEAAGRQQRYEFFKKLCLEYGIDKIATAHNRNDNAETIAMNFMRGSGVKGLCGIPYMRGNIIRPVLDVTRAEIEEYCKRNSLDYVTDSTNCETVYTRNKIRSILIPLIQSGFNPNFINTVTDNAVLLQEDSDYLDALSEEAYKSVVRSGGADIDLLLACDIAIKRRIIRKMIREARGSLEDISSLYINDILTLIEKNSGASIDLPQGFIAKNEYGRLIIEEKQKAPQPFECTLEFNVPCIIPEIGMKAAVSEVSERRRDGAIYLSYDKGGKIVVRSRREGDKFNPCGMTGSKKVKEYFINNKIPREKRGLIPIVEIDGKIAAVGDRVDRGFLFKDRGIRIEFKPFQEVAD